MTRQERFEKIWAVQHGVPPESLVQYRWITQDGYRLPGMAAHYRTFCETLDSVGDAVGLLKRICETFDGCFHGQAIENEVREFLEGSVK